MKVTNNNQFNHTETFLVSLQISETHLESILSKEYQSFPTSSEAQRAESRGSYFEEL